MNLNDTKLFFLFRKRQMIWIICLGLLLPTQTFAFHEQMSYQNSYQDILLTEVIDKIAETYDVNIIYDVDQLGEALVKDVKIGNKSAEADLKSILNNQSFSFSKLNASTFVIKKSVSKPVKTKPVEEKSAPEITVTGSVYDQETNEPLIGVNILIKDGITGTVSDINGEFILKVEEGQTLVFSYLGYIDKEIVANSSNMGAIYMEEDANQLEEVVVVGYGTQKRSDLTGALSSVSEKELKQLPVSGLDQALQGRAAGVFVTQNSGAPGGGVSIRIRGIGSTLSAEPLYVIDGIPVVNDNQGTSANFSELDGGGQNSNALNTINPSDIESIEVLKDASATAIYGARAANGVVLITTKRGEAGTSNLSFETYYGVQQLARKVPVMNLREYSEYYADAGWENLEEFERPELLGEGTDWQDAVFRDAGMQNYQMTVSGGTKKTTYALSGNYHIKDGIVVGSSFNRMTGKVNLDHKLSDRFRIGNSFLFSRTNERITLNDNSNGVVFTALRMVPSAPVKNADGTFAGPQEEITLSFDNPVARALETDDRNRKTRLLSNIYAEADLLPYLKYRTEFGTDIVYSNHNTFFPSFQRGNFSGKSGVRRNLSNSFFWINKHLLTFNKTFAERHTLSALGGFEGQAGTFEWLFASRENLPTNDLRQLTLGDAGQQQNDGGAGHFALLSYFGRANYNFDERYLLTATLRRDGSSRFGENNRWGMFPSAAFAWRLSNEAFLKKVDYLDNLKLRVGYGVVGNQEIGLYAFSSNLRSYAVAFGDQLYTGFGPANISNPDVRWESSLQTNFGFDLGLWNNRVEVIADYYQKKADGMLLPALLPLTAGSLEPPFVNIGEIINKGVELSLKTANLTGKLKWNTSLNYTVNRNEVISLGSNGNLVGILQSLPVTRTEEGRPISQFYGHVVEGIFQSNAEIAESPSQSPDTRAGDIKFKDLDNNGVIDDNDRTFIGNPLPDFTINLINDFNYKGFDLNFFFQGVYGNEVLNLVRRDIEGLAGLSNQSKVAADRFRNLEPSTTIPRQTNEDPNSNRRISDRWIEDGSFLRLRNVTLGYNVPRVKLKKRGFKSLRLYASAQNVYTWTNYSGYDPEVGSFNQNPLINGVDNGRYPISRSVTFGLNANF